MEMAQIYLSNAELFDARLKENRTENLPECGNLEFITKDAATVNGLPACMITFTIMDGDKQRRVQAVTTARMIMTVAAAMRGRYGEI